MTIAPPGADIKRASQLYRTFSHLDVREKTPISFLWPSVQGVYGRATGIGYTSDKWDYEWRDFIHTHDKSLPVILRQKQPGDELWKRTFPAKHNAWPILGRVLDIGVEFDGEYETAEPHHISYLDRRRNRLPLILGDLSRRLLIIVDPFEPKEPALLLWGKDLEITDRGIVG